jgi:hypothetical protein
MQRREPNAADSGDERLIADLIRESGASEAQIKAADRESQRAFERAGLARKEARREARSRKAG